MGINEKGLVAQEGVVSVRSVTESPVQLQTPIQKSSGAKNTAFGKDLLCLCLGASNLSSKPTESTPCGLYELMNTLTDMNPQDEIEGVLCSQIISLHRLSMLALARIEKATQYDLMDRHVSRAAKLMRLQHESIEALNRHRRQGKQTVLVQHVNISGEGKAVLSNVVGGGVQEKQGYQPHG